MKLWTIQPVDVYNNIMSSGKYFCDPNRSSLLEDDLFRNAYSWLVKEMEKRIGDKPEYVKFPVWAWHTWEWKHKKPDLRSFVGKKGPKMVCIELEIPDNEVVLSDFDSWHYVLNKWHFGYETSDEELAEKYAWLDSLSNEEREQEIKKSWQNVFNIEKINTYWIIQGQFVQATFWEIKKEQVRKIQFFTSK